MAIKFKTFPHYRVNVKDESITSVFQTEVLPLHIPLFLGYAEKGPVNTPVIGDYATLKEVFGAGTFDIYSKYFKHPNVFLRKACEYQQVFYCRLAPEAVKSASLVLECNVKTGVQITQYQKDEFGGRVLNTNGEPIPLTDDGDIVTEPGIQITWTVRALTGDETISNLTPRVSGTTTTYPIIAFQADSPGAWANKVGFKIWFDASTVDKSVVEDISALLFNIGIVSQDYGIDTPTPIRDLYNEEFTEFSFKPDAIDPSTEKRLMFEDIIENDYQNNVPFNYHVYASNVELIGTVAQGVEPDDENVAASPWLVDIMSGTNLLGYPYDHIVVLTDEDDTTIMHADVIQYMSSGADGSLTESGLESLTKTWLTGETFPDIYDSARYPITHLWDSGYVLDTKKQMIDFMSIRDDVKIMLSTQDVSKAANTKSEDQSTGSALRSRALLHPESNIYGTQVCRCTIMQQCGKEATGMNWKGLVPATYDTMIKKCIYQGTSRLTGKPKGLPGSAVEVLKDINWFATTDDHKQLSWDTGLNYMQHYDLTRYHYADVRTVYPYETSLLSDDIFSDILTYIKHIARKQWSVFVGRDEPAYQLYGDIRQAVSQEIYDVFGTAVRSETNVYQTDVDRALGYQSTIEIAVYGTMPNRVWNVIVPVRRDTEEG